jgi:hypothetical protein
MAVSNFAFVFFFNMCSAVIGGLTCLRILCGLTCFQGDVKSCRWYEDRMTERSEQRQRAAASAVVLCEAIGCEHWHWAEHYGSSVNNFNIGSKQGRSLRYASYAVA